MELEELKNKWKQLDEHVKAQDDKIRELTDRIMAGKVKSPLMLLRRHCIIAAIFVPFMLPFFFCVFYFIGLECAVWQRVLLYILTWAFVLFTFARELYFINDLKHINIGRETALESLKRTIRFRKHFHWWLVADAILGFIFLTTFISCIGFKYIVGGAVGGVIGGMIGYRIYRKEIHAINDLEIALREWTK